MDKIAPTVVIWPNLGPHHVARLRALAEVQKRVVGIEIARRQAAYQWESDREGLPFEILSLFDETYENLTPGRIGERVTGILERLRPKAVAFPGVEKAHYRMIARWASKMKIPTICLMASTYEDFPRSHLREAVKRYLLPRYFDGVACTGIRSYRYSRHLGFSDSQIWTIGNAVDNSFFESAAANVRVKPESFREEFDLPHDYFLYVGRFHPKKNLLFLLEAYQRYVGRGGKWALVLVGGGPEQVTVCARAAALRGGTVKIAEWLQADRLPVVYALGSCFVLPSTSEPWGLVVNEAMACGLPLIVSEKCGCWPELCRRGLNGFVISPFDIESLTVAMLRMSSSSVNRQAMRRWSETLVHVFTLEGWARGLSDCVETLVSGCSN